MSDDLPQGWAVATLDQIAEINPRHPPDLDPAVLVTFVPMPAVSETGWRFQFTEEHPFREVRRGYTHFADGDVLFAKITPCMENGKAAVATDLKNALGCGSTELHVLRPRGTNDPRFIYHFLHQETFRQEAARNFTGTAGQLRVPVSFIREAEIPVAPVEEQHRIVAKLETLLGKVDSSQKRLAKIPVLLKRFRQSVLAAACSGRLTADWRKEHEATPAIERWNLTAAPLESPALTEIPATWVWRRLSDMSERVSVGHVGPTSQFYCNSNVGIPFIRSQNVRPGKLMLENVQFVTREFHDSLGKSSLRPGDILIVRVGANRGDTCRVPEGIGPLNCANIVFARLLPGVSDFVEQYCQSKLGQDFLLDMGRVGFVR